MSARLLEVRGQLQRADGVTHIVVNYWATALDALMRVVVGELPSGHDDTSPGSVRARGARIRVRFASRKVARLSLTATSAAALPVPAPNPFVSCFAKPARQVLLP